MTPDGPGGGIAPGGERARVLAIDERPEVLRLVERTLDSHYEYSFAGSVDEARRQLAAHPVDLALCDIQMPGESSLSLVEEIARDHLGTAIVLVTGVDDPDVAERAFRLGAHGYLVKPFWPGQLLITAGNALRQHQLEVAERNRHDALLGSSEERSEALRHELIEAQRQAIKDLRAACQETVDRLTTAIEMHDEETGRHVGRMASVAAFLGENAGLDAEQVRRLRAAAPMHDIGKIAISDEILHKPGPLSAEERREMETHTIVGYRILAGSESDLLQTAAQIALTHHEWFDGSGYPRGLSDRAIPLEGRIVAVADVFDALISDRCYRPAMSVEEAVALIDEERGTHFDPEIATALLDNLDGVLAARA